MITDLLTEKGALLNLSYFVHSYPHDWRTKKPVIFRATPQWFASIDAFRQEILDVIENEVKWYHPSGQVRIYNMVRDRGDWVISRNVYGEFRYLYFMLKMVNQLLHQKQQNMLLKFSKNMVQMYGLNGMQKTYYQKASLIQILQMVSLQKS